jgi:hypothetical protein
MRFSVGAAARRLKQASCMGIDGFLVLVLRLAAGIMAVQDPGRPVNAEEALSWATAIAVHAGRASLDPYELVGIARNESDFTPEKIGPDGKDCGITQTRVTFSRYRCRELRQNTFIAFAEAARELSENQARCLRWFKGDLTRCRINSYNSGVHYARSGWSGGYWLRVSCFAEAARRGLKPTGDCRRVHNRGDIARLLTQSEVAAVVAVPPPPAVTTAAVAGSAASRLPRRARPAASRPRGSRARRRGDRRARRPLP